MCNIAKTLQILTFSSIQEIFVREINPSDFDFSSSSTMRLTFVAQSDLSLQTLDGLLKLNENFYLGQTVNC